MKKKAVVFVAVILAVVCALGALSACKAYYPPSGAQFASTAKSSFSNEFTQLDEKRNGKTLWRDGMVSGNGEQGVITSGAPYSDTLIYQNIHFILPNANPRVTPDTADELESVRQAIIKKGSYTDSQPYLDVYGYHPGAQLRIRQEEREYSGFMRYTNYETAEVGVRYTDDKGQWDRRTFTSWADGVTITQITSSDKEKPVTAEFTFDNISSFAKFGDGSEVDIKYKKYADKDGYMTFVAHYPSYEGSELKEGGYATICYIISEGADVKTTENDLPDEKQYAGSSNPGLKVKKADTVYVISVSGRTAEMGAYDAFADQEEFALTDELKAQVKAVADKYTDEEGYFDYEGALKAHTDIFTPQFNAVEFSLGADITVANEDLIRKYLPWEDLTKTEIDKTLAERAYYSGRYAALCCSGTSTSRLGGMWTGEFNPDWGSKFTMDANVNLQTAAMNTGNISSSPVGYVYFILRQAPDWEENAMATHGYTKALQAPVHTDGDNASIVESCYEYPFRYWNAGTSWMLYPMYETLMCYGDMHIPLSDEFDLDELKSVLSPSSAPLTDAQINAIKSRGYLDLRTEILYPLLVNAANYWQQLLTPEYYTRADGSIAYTQGKTSLEEGESYCIIPSYSPENTPANYNSPAAANCAIDISACLSNMYMVIDIAKSIDENADTSVWEGIIRDLPPYLFDDTGALKEWATTDFEEQNSHRHLSHLYLAWPMFETQQSDGLKQAAIQAVENRASENEASHALVHRSLIAARLNDREALTDALKGLMNSYIYYDSLLTNHHTNAESGYCTDYAIGYTGIVNEALVYSYTGEVGLLPALPTSGFDEGVIKGIRLRTRATLTSMSWTKSGVEAVITSDVAQTLTVTCGMNGKQRQITFAAGESKTVSFAF